MGVVFTGFLLLTSLKEEEITLLGVATYTSSYHAACIIHQLCLKPCPFLTKNNRFSINDVALLNRGVE